MLQVTDELLKEMTDIIVREVNPRKVILFGSRARGEAGPDSDLDFLIEEEEPFGPERSRHAEMTRIWKALGNYYIPIDILVFSMNEMEQWRTARNHVIARALKEGKVLYERS